MNKQKHDEAHLKALVLSKLRSEGRLRRDCVLASELKLPSGGARIDLAILGTSFIGIEIKSPLDSLRRLDNQLAAYLAYFDSVILVVAEKHLSALTGNLIRNVEVWEFVGRDSRLNLHRETCTDAIRTVQARHRLDFLTKTERARHLPAKSTGTYADMSSADEHQALRAALDERYGATTKAFWEATARRQIRPGDLRNLSRFYDHRMRQEAAEKEREEYWSRWRAAARQVLSDA